jgi:hypothetical protein
MIDIVHYVSGFSAFRLPPRSLPNAMATNSTLPPLPNPFTPMAFLPPTLAAQLQADIYLNVACMAVSCQIRDVDSRTLNLPPAAKAYTWDWLMSIPEEIAMCRRRLHLAHLAYFLSR